MAELDDPEFLPTQSYPGAQESPTISATPPPQDSDLSPGLSPSRRGWTPPEPSQLQASFPQYEIRGVLGRGGMGAVYQGWQKSLRRLVAIKILPPGLQDNGANFAERFQREAHAMARFSHPGIVTVYDAGETSEGLFYFVMEYIEGTDVQKMVRTQGPLSAEHAVAITVHVCDALAYAHKRGVIHRDIKPSNIMVDAEGQIKVADFGLAKLANDESAAFLTGTHVNMGTPDFMAPEALYGIGKVDHRADLYAVGVMLYQMLTGEVPRGRFDLPSVQKPGVDPRFDSIVDRAMQKNPDKRYANATEIRTDLDKILTTPWPAVTIAPPPPPPSPAPLPPNLESTPTAPLPPLPKARPMPKWLGAAIAAALLFIVAAVVHSRSPAQKPLSNVATAAASSSAHPAVAKSAPAPEVKLTPAPAAKPSLPAIATAPIVAKSSPPPETVASTPSPALPSKEPSLLEATNRVEAIASPGKEPREVSEKTGDSVAAMEAKLNAPTAVTDTVPPKDQKENVVVKSEVAVVQENADVNSLGMKFVPAGTPGVLFCMWDTRVKDFAEFIRDSGYDMSKGEKPFTMEGSSRGGFTWKQAGGSWRDPHFPKDMPQTDENPVVCVSIDDAHAFCTWLSKKEGRRYRLPKDHEWSVAVGIGDRENPSATPKSKDGKIKGVFPWGTTWPPAKGAGNFAGAESRIDVSATKNWAVIPGYDDGFPRTSPVGTFAANQYGLYDMSGNVWQWCEDLYDPASGHARVLRGSPWRSFSSVALHSSCRVGVHPGSRTDNLGFRCVLEGKIAPLPPTAPPPGR